MTLPSRNDPAKQVKISTHMGRDLGVFSYICQTFFQKPYFFLIFVKLILKFLIFVKLIIFNVNRLQRSTIADTSRESCSSWKVEAWEGQKRRDQ